MLVRGWAVGAAFVYQLVVGEEREETAQPLSLVRKVNIGILLRNSISSCLKKSIFLIHGVLSR